MPNYGKFLKELVNKKHKIKQISAAFLSDESSSILQNKVPAKLRDPESFLIPCNFDKAFSCNDLAELGASINLMPYSLYVKLSLKTLKPTKMSVRLVDRSFKYPVGITKNMLIEVGKFTFPPGFVILEMEEDSKVPLILGRPFLHTVDVLIRVKQKQLNLEVRTKRIIFHIDSMMKHSYLNSDTCFSIDVIDEILEEDFDALLNEEPPFEKITFNTNYKIKTSIEEPPTDLELKPLPDNLEYVFLEEPSFLPIIISSQFFEENKNKLKGGITVVTNERNELVPTRTVTEGFVLGYKVSEAGLKVDKAKINVISKIPPPTNIKAQQNYIITEKELMTVVFTFDKFRSNLALLKTIVHIDHSALSEVDNFLGENLMEINTKDEPWFEDFANYLASDIIPKGMTYQQQIFFPQTSDTTSGRNRTSSKKLDDALWAFRTTYKTPTETTPYKLIYGNNCHLLFEIENRAYWALKNCNPVLIVADEKRMFQLHELDELRHQAYENSHLYKARTKVWHDEKLKIRK
uniref:Reverse transcriptase domain-containing protein n=1 Tax=Tanacetum cinerariifolium TaxID=118510 RepID=A0A6L2K9L6_TANCI|nr:reverse transcriptase domain-containing protein [Tanacetum cinerariifolium]